MAESYGAINDMVCAVINESSSTALECALRCECRANFIRKRLNLYKHGFKIYDLLVVFFGVSRCRPPLGRTKDSGESRNL